MIWVLLCGFDQHSSTLKSKEAATTGKGRQLTNSSGTGYGGDRSSLGRGIFGRGMAAKDTVGIGIDPHRIMAETAEKAADDFNRAIFLLLTTLLPSPDNNNNFDVNPPGAVASMLTHSNILNKAAELLRNDSLDNASKRRDLYDALLGFLRNIGTHQAMSKEVMFSERLVMPGAINLFTLSFRGVPKGVKEEPSSSLADLLRNLNIQSNMMMKGALNNQEEFKNQEGRDILWLCRKISDLASYLLGANQAEAITTDCGIIDVPDKDIYPTYYYSKLAEALRHSPTGRIKRLITEITSLKTGLSTGIYVKFASSRLDIMK
jgi:hypothetical protein